MDSKEKLYEHLCSALRKPLSDGGHLALIASLKDQSATNIAEALELMTGDEATLIFNWLEDRRAIELLDEVDPEMADYIINHAAPGRLAAMGLTALTAP